MGSHFAISGGTNAWTTSRGRGDALLLFADPVALLADEGTHERGVDAQRRGHLDAPVGRLHVQVDVLDAFAEDPDLELVDEHELLKRSGVAASAGRRAPGHERLAPKAIS